MYSRPQTKYPLVVKTIVVCKTWVAASKTAGVGSNPTAPAKITIQKVKKVINHFLFFCILLYAAIKPHQNHNFCRARNFAAPIFVYLTFSKQYVIINV